MNNEDFYYTIKKTSEGIFKDKGSKFIAFAFPADNEENAKVYLENIKKEHHNARHHCFAWKFGRDGKTYRANDDGEPSGTAGKPILGQLNSNNLTNIIVIVVRYFGGTLLGVSGLINAYKNATIEALNNAEVIKEVIKSSYKLTFEYPLMNNVMRVVKEEKLEITDTKYELDCMIKFKVRLNKENEIVSRYEKIEGIKIEKA